MGRPARVCSRHGCPQLEPCPDHGGEQRPNAHERGYDARWQRYVASYVEAHPWCRPCARDGRKTPTQAVDHIEPVTGPADPGFWDPANHQPICRSCHGVKTHAEGRTQRRSQRVTAQKFTRWIVQ